ncbi:MAG: hypothetical protein RBR71_01320 [Gudongella sp.]|nr:hypothetical protein [Gudongella sp.]
MEFTKEQLIFLKKLSNGGSLTHDILGDEINHQYPCEEKDVEAKKQCEEMVEKGYLVSNGFGYEITQKGMNELR